MSIGERIRIVRKDLGMSQKEFGDRIGISDNYVSEIESGKKEPSVPILLAIEYRFGISMVWIKTGEGKKEASKEVKDVFSVSEEEKEIIRALRKDRELKSIVKQIVKKSEK